ncbi:MAG: cyclic pyranopterin monophosphate synthase MoaC [Mycobacterium sp.]|nr:cyclic pyranopterin monophosphate synthase MoaC [Mycobacterium sp.]
MVDVSGKTRTSRSATATGVVRTTAQVISQVADRGLAKGDALATARIAAIQAAKRTSELIPLCHQIPLSSIDVDFVIGDTTVEVIATARTTDRTGVEMEALTAVTVGALTVYDMIKALDPAARIEGVRVLHKQGGQTGVWDAPR